MNESSTGPRYLMRWDHSRDQRLGRDLLTTTHRLAELPLFSDEGLAELLDRFPRGSILVSTMGDNPAYPSQSQVGELGRHAGIELVDMIRRGRLCVRMTNVVENYEQLGRIVQRLYGELMECQPGLRTSVANGDLEISSPTALTFFRHDTRPTVFWQVRGSRQILIYPSGEPFISTPVGKLDGRKPAYFEPAFDTHADQRPQDPGDVLALPMHRPYRVVNDKRLCVTLITQCETRESRQETHLGIALKQMLLNVLHRQREAAPAPLEPTFCVDPDSPLCIGPREQTAADFSSTVAAFPGLHFDAQPTAHQVSEN